MLQGGKILALPKDRSSSKSEVFLDISGMNMIEKAFEEGLLGLVFHPNFKKNRKFYLYHTLQNPKRSRLVERRMSKKDPGKPDQKYERLLLEVPQPYWNHNSGNPIFGPDGFLYIGLGDGGQREMLQGSGKARPAAGVVQALAQAAEQMQGRFHAVVIRQAICAVYCRHVFLIRVTVPRAISCHRFDRARQQARPPLAGRGQRTCGAHGQHVSRHRARHLHWREPPHAVADRRAGSRPCRC